MNRTAELVQKRDYQIVCRCARSPRGLPWYGMVVATVRAVNEEEAKAIFRRSYEVRDTLTVKEV